MNIHDDVKAVMSTNTPAQRTAVDVRQPTLVQAIANSQRYERKGKKWKELTDAITYFIAKDALPIYTVEKPRFKQLLSSLDPRYEVPSRSCFSMTALPTLNASTRDKEKQELSEVQHFSATTDLWFSIRMQPYISYTIHFIHDEWKLQNRCLQTHFLPDDHTGENLVEVMEATLEAWELNAANQVCLTTDNGTNFNHAAELFGWTRLSCFGHNLHLAIANAPKDNH